MRRFLEVSRNLGGTRAASSIAAKLRRADEDKAATEASQAKYELSRRWKMASMNEMVSNDVAS